MPHLIARAIDNTTAHAATQYRLDGWTSSPAGRGSLDIVWSCLSNLALLTGSAVCVNVLLQELAPFD
jgi:hypothetical protein